MIPRNFFFTILICAFNVCATFTAVATATPDCIGAFASYALFAFVTCICVCSIVCLVINFFQLVDWIFVRIAYLRHHPEYRNQNVAALLRLI
ncbi:E3 RID-alpha [Human mastadenovirus B]|nr:E3 RID-alpha [Human mastadenovirus B]